MPAPQALLYDVHGNLPALEAVLDDTTAEGVERFVLGGDYALFGAFPKETVERMRGLEATWIRGNTDRWLRDDSDAPDNAPVQRSLALCREQLGADAVDELASLPERAPSDDVLFCHASPRSDMETFPPEPAEGEEALLAGAEPDVLVFGHSHHQFMREAHEMLLVNPGSVGMPFDGDRRAAYALWRGGREVEPRRVEYDLDAYLADVRERMGAALGGGLEVFVRRLEQAAYVS